MDPWTYESAKDIALPPVERARSLRRESGLISTAGHLGWRLLSRLYFRLYHRLSVEAIGPLPERPPFIMIANHSSHLDAALLASVLPYRSCDHVFPVAAGDVFFTTPVSSLLSATLINALPMWRRRPGSHALAELRRRLVEEPCALILFPEGGRSRDGSLLPFKPGLGMLTAGTGVPVIPCHVSGAYEAFPPNAHWPRPGKIRLSVGHPLVFDSVPNAREGWEHVVSRCREAVLQLGGRRRTGEHAS